MFSDTLLLEDYENISLSDIVNLEQGARQDYSNNLDNIITENEMLCFIYDGEIQLQEMNREIFMQLEYPIITEGVKDLASKAIKGIKDTFERIRGLISKFIDWIIGKFKKNKNKNTLLSTYIKEVDKLKNNEYIKKYLSEATFTPVIITNKDVVFNAVSNLYDIIDKCGDISFKGFDSSIKSITTSIHFKKDAQLSDDYDEEKENSENKIMIREYCDKTKIAADNINFGSKVPYDQYKNTIADEEKLLYNYDNNMSKYIESFKRALNKVNGYTRQFQSLFNNIDPKTLPNTRKGTESIIKTCNILYTLYANSIKLATKLEWCYNNYSTNARSIENAIEHAKNK